MSGFKIHLVISNNFCSSDFAHRLLAAHWIDLVSSVVVMPIVLDAHELPKPIKELKALLIEQGIDFTPGIMKGDDLLKID